MKELDNTAKLLTKDIKNLEILNNKYIDIGDIRIFGSILWSYIPTSAPQRYLPIYNDNKDLLSRDEFNMLNYSCITALQNCIEQTKKDDKELIVVTHYSPTFDMYDKMDQMNYWYCNDLDELICEDNMKVWLFGHTHTPYKKIMNGTIVMSNPYVSGYIKGLGINMES